MVAARLLVGMLLVAFGNIAWAQTTVPDREVPPSVMAEVGLLQNRFELALAADCDSLRCFPKGCTYVDHAVTDRPRSMSLPGLGQDPGPGSVDTQEYLTRARCSFAVEENVEAEDVGALTRRLQSKLSTGWTVVSVDSQRLAPLPSYLQEPPAPEVPEAVEEPIEEPEPVSPEWSWTVAAQELWATLLPHFSWMIAVFLLTLACVVVIYALRRVGQASIEDQMLMAELANGGGGGGPDGDDEDDEAPTAAVEDEDYVAAEDATWRARLEAMDPDDPEPAVQALIHELLTAGDLPLLAKAVLKFPEHLPAAFPTGGEVAAAKLALSDYLKSVAPEDLPSDTEFFQGLNRQVLAATVASQNDARIVRSLREEFGAAGLAQLIGRLPPRSGALLFALAPSDEQQQTARLLPPKLVADMSEMLLRSNRMDPAETEFLFDVVSAVRGESELPDKPPSRISDRGAPFDAEGALSVLLEKVHPAGRTALFGAALKRFHGTLPAWYRGILVGDMLLSLADEARADLMLEVDVEPLAAWMSLLDADTKTRLLAGAPTALLASVQSYVFPSRGHQLAMAERGRKDLATSFQNQLARAKMDFADVVYPQGSADS
jgi:hypothetical protein